MPSPSPTREVEVATIILDDIEQHPINWEAILPSSSPTPSSPPTLPTPDPGTPTALSPNVVAFLQNLPFPSNLLPSFNLIRERWESLTNTRTNLENTTATLPPGGTVPLYPTPYFSNIQALSGALANHATELRDVRLLTNVPRPPLTQEFTTLLQEFPCTISLTGGGQLAVTFTTPVVLESFNLGIFTVTFLDNFWQDPRVSNIWITSDHQPINDHCHPHVSESHHLCTGDHHASFQLALSEFRIVDALDITNGILRHYNRHSPYQTLSAWTNRDGAEHCHHCGISFEHTNCLEEQECAPGDYEPYLCQHTGCRRALCHDCNISCASCFSVCCSTHIHITTCGCALCDPPSNLCSACSNHCQLCDNPICPSCTICAYCAENARLELLAADGDISAALTLAEQTIISLPTHSRTNGYTGEMEPPLEPVPLSYFSRIHPPWPTWRNELAGVSPRNTTTQGDTNV